MELSSQMVLFASVVEHGSFSGAAREANQSPSAVSKQIGHLENRLGLRLVNRTQQGISLTEEGRVFYARCAEISRTVAEAQDLLQSLAAHPQGVLSVASTVAFGKAQIMPLMPDFMEKYPDIRVKMEVTDRPVDLHSEELDVAIRLTEQLNNDQLIARKIAPNRRVLCASPSYVKRYGAPQKPSDLADHNCLRLSTVQSWNDWCLDGADGEECVPVTGNFEASSADAVYHAALAGIGIARLSTYLVGGDIRAGRLVRLLPGYTQQGSDIFAIYSGRRNLSPKIRVFLDHLVAHFGSVPPWERDEAQAL